MSMYKAARLAAFVLCAATAAPAADFTHVASIDLGTSFNDTTGYGDNPLSIAFDGTNAYIGGWKNTANSPGTAGVVKVENVFGGAPAMTPLEATLYTCPVSRGTDALAYETTTASLIISHDSGTAATSFITRRQASDGELGASGWTVMGPQGARPFAMALDPAGDAGSPGVAFLTQGSGRRRLLSLTDGTTVHDGSTGGVINTAPDSGTTWRCINFDSAGNVVVSNQRAYGYGIREGVNRWEALDGALNVTARSVLKGAEVNNVGQGIVILKDLGRDVIAFATRGASQTLTDLSGAVESVSSAAVHVRNPDGSKTDLPVTELLGDEDGLGSAWTGELKNLAYGAGSDQKDYLLVVSFIERRLNVYEVIKTPVGPVCPDPFADADDDGDVDMDDFGVFQTCFDPAGVPEGCACFERNGDDAISLADFGDPSDPQPNTFLGCVSGPEIDADTACDDAPQSAALSGPAARPGAPLCSPHE